jgi:predicted DNA-binding transcriptional regulator AlpA
MALLVQSTSSKAYGIQTCQAFFAYLSCVLMDFIGLMQFAVFSGKHGKEKNHDTLCENNSTWRYVMLGNIAENSLLRLPQVLALIPVSKSTWWAGCKSGRFPKPVKLGPRTTAWRAVEIAALLERIAGKQEEEK